MSGENRLTVTRLRESRERVITALQDHFAHDNLDVEEFERRVTVAHSSASLEEIEALTSDLAPLPASATTSVPAVTQALVPADSVSPAQTIRGFMSSTTRTGSWTVPRRVEVRSVMSSNVLDFREARFPAGTIDLEVHTVMSSVEIIVPPGLAVEMHGDAILGTFDELDRSPAQPDPDAPVLRIRGRAIMSAVEVRMRLPGETERQSRLRKRKELPPAEPPKRALGPLPKRPT